MGGKTNFQTASKTEEGKKRSAMNGFCEKKKRSQAG